MSTPFEEIFPENASAVAKEWLGIYHKGDYPPPVSRWVVLVENLVKRVDFLFDETDRMTQLTLDVMRERDEACKQCAPIRSHTSWLECRFEDYDGVFHRCLLCEEDLTGEVFFVNWPTDRTFQAICETCAKQLGWLVPDAVREYLV